jgi:hypothetical protein
MSYQGVKKLFSSKSLKGGRLSKPDHLCRIESANVSRIVDAFAFVSVLKSSLALVDGPFRQWQANPE